MNPATAAPTPDTSSLKGTILVVDDNPDDREVLARPLERLAGYSVEPFECGEEALNRMKINGVELLIVDVHLRKTGISGLTFVRRLRERKCATPVLLLSAELNEDEERIARGFRHCRVLKKPVTGAVLVETVESMVDQYQVRATLAGIEVTLGVMNEAIARIPKPGPISLAGLLAYRTTVLIGLSVILPLIIYMLESLGWTGVVTLFRHLDEIVKKAAQHP